MPDFFGALKVACADRGFADGGLLIGGQGGKPFLGDDERDGRIDVVRNGEVFLDFKDAVLEHIDRRMLQSVDGMDFQRSEHFGISHRRGVNPHGFKAFDRNGALHDADF